ncbi:MAG: M20/M25/M40 family metallo-hydrolase, partial [Blastocatellia bacterium]
MPDSNGPSRELLVYFQEHHDDALALLRWLVEQESMSRVPDATAKIAEGLGAKLEEIGAKVELLRDPAFGASILARFQPPEPPEDPKQLLVIGHIDTVWPIGTLSKRPFRIEGDRAYGPGTFDMKAGLTIASFAMRALRDLGRQPKRPVTFLFTCDEETGSHFSRDTIEREGRKSLSALVVEPPIPGGRVKTGRKGVGEFELVTYGRSAHAGNDPRAGINAITELAHQVLAINAMNDYERGTTLNVGVVSGGVLSNVVAAEARARIDMRYKTTEEGLRITEALSKLKPVVD